MKALLTAGVLLTVAFAGVTAEPINRLDGAGEGASASSSAFTASLALPNSLSAERPRVEGRAQMSSQEDASGKPAPSTTYPDAYTAIQAHSEPTLSAAQVRERDLVAAVVEHFPREHWQTVFSVAWCESRYDTAAVGAAGERGSMQIQPRVWGAVPSDVWGQMRQAAAIVSVHGFAPWSCFR